MKGLGRLHYCRRGNSGFQHADKSIRAICDSSTKATNQLLRASRAYQISKDGNNPRNGAKQLPREANKPSNGAKQVLLERNQPRNGAISTFVKPVPGSDAWLNGVEQSQNLRYSRLCSKRTKRKLRDREPSRINIRKIIRLLKCRKLRLKRKKMIKKLVPFSSVLYGIVTNYKFWKVRDISKEDSFYSEYFKRANKYTILYNISEQSILLCGAVELNPGPNEISFIALTLH